jgi:hypothetical protein
MTMRALVALFAVAALAELASAYSISGLTT